MNRDFMGKPNSMEQKFIDGRYLHIDVSGSLNNKKTISGIACVSNDNKYHIGTAISIKLKKDLSKQLKAHINYPQVHAILVYRLLIETPLEKYLGIVSCCDSEPKKMLYYLDSLLEKNIEYKKLCKLSISELRQIMGDYGLDSLAHKKANAYRKRGLNELKRDKGTKLNFVEINFKFFEQHWKK